MPITNPKKHYLWPKFQQYVENLAKNDGVCIGMEYEEDWLDLWKFFLAGAEAVTNSSAIDLIRNA